MPSNFEKKRLSPLLKALFLGLLPVILIYTVFLVLYLSGFINGFIFLGVLFLIMAAALVILLLFRKRKFVLQTTLFSFVLTSLLFGYEARLLNYESITYLVDSYREPEELLPNTELYLLSVGLHDIHYIQEEKMLMDTLKSNAIQPLEITKVSNVNRYNYKTADILSFLRFEKDLFQSMGENVQHFIGEKPPFIEDFLKRENLEGNSAGLILGLYALMDRGELANDIPIGVTGTLEKNGDIMEVGGIRAKTMISAEKNFRYMLVPADNLQEAKQVKSEMDLSIEIIPVIHINEAVEIINNLNQH